jgi:hypothetical protein
MVGGFELESEGLHALFFHEAALHAALKVLLRKMPTVCLLAVVLSQARRVLLCYLLALIQMIQWKAPFLRLRFYKALACWGCHPVRAPAALPRKGFHLIFWKKYFRRMRNILYDEDVEHLPSSHSSTPLLKVLQIQLPQKTAHGQAISGSTISLVTQLPCSHLFKAILAT